MVTLQFKVECKLVNSKQLKEALSEKELQVLQEELSMDGDSKLGMV